jgi:aspartate beta-hydroxylase
MTAQLMPSTYDFAVKSVSAMYNRSIRSPAILETSQYFPEAEKFEASFEAIRHDVLTLDRRKLPVFHDLMPEQAEISAQDGLDWRMFVLKAYRREVPENLFRVPTLARLLRQSPNVISAAISVLAPHKYVPPHTGPFRGILRFHMVLKTPMALDGHPATCLTIDGVPHRIGEGDTLLWDDTYLHEVVNEGEEERIALLLDVWRPRMPFHLNALSHLIVRGVSLGIAWRGVKFVK